MQEVQCAEAQPQTPFHEIMRRHGQRFVDRVNELKPEYEDEGGLFWRLWEERRSSTVVAANSRRAYPQPNFDRLMKQHGEREARRVRCSLCSDIPGTLVRMPLLSSDRKVQYGHAACIKKRDQAGIDLFASMTAPDAAPLPTGIMTAMDAIDGRIVNVGPTAAEVLG